MLLSPNETNIFRISSHFSIASVKLGNFKVGNFVSEVCGEEFTELLPFGVEKVEFLSENLSLRY